MDRPELLVVVADSNIPVPPDSWAGLGWEAAQEPAKKGCYCNDATHTPPPKLKNKLEAIPGL